MRTDGKRKHVFIRTYGCQMNVYDSDRMADVLRPLGYALATTPEQADLVVLNTCHIREHASEKVYSELGRMRDLKVERRAEGATSPSPSPAASPRPKARRSRRRQPAVDIVVGPQAYHRLPQLLAEAERKAAILKAGKRLPGAGVLDTEFPVESKFDHLPAPQGVRAGSAFLSIQEGCDKFCTFCVVPYTRGAEYSRPAAKVLAEARQLVDAGAVEITLLGQNVNAYHGEARRRVDLVARAACIRALAEIDGVDAHPLHDLASARHGRRSDRRAWRGAAAHAVPASAGAVGLGPHPRGDEPPARPRPFPRARRPAARGAAGSRSVVRLHRRLSRRERRGFRRHDAADRAGRLRVGLLLQVQPPSRHAGRGDGRAGARSGEGRPALGVAGAAWPAGAGLQQSQGGHRPCRCCSPSRAASPAS